MMMMMTPMQCCHLVTLWAYSILYQTGLSRHL